MENAYSNLNGRNITDIAVLMTPVRDRLSSLLQELRLETPDQRRHFDKKRTVVCYEPNKGIWESGDMVHLILKLETKQQ